MTIDYIWEGFRKLFPTWIDEVEKHRKVGSKTIELTMKNGKKLLFLYNDPWDWSFGSKIWRARPKMTADQLLRKWERNLVNFKEEDDLK